MILSVVALATLGAMSAGCADSAPEDSADGQRAVTDVVGAQTTSHKFQYTAKLSGRFSKAVVVLDVTVDAPASATQEKVCEPHPTHPERLLCKNQIVGLEKKIKIASEFAVNEGFAMTGKAHDDLDLELETAMRRCTGDLACSRGGDVAPFVMQEFLPDFQGPDALAAIGRGELPEVATSFYRHGIGVSGGAGGATLSIIEGGVFPVGLTLAVSEGKASSKESSVSREGKLDVSMPDTFTLPASMTVSNMSEDIDLEFTRVAL